MAEKKLSESQIAEMKSMRASSISTRKIAAIFNVSKTTVNNYTSEYTVKKVKKERKSPVIFRWEVTESKIFDLLSDFYSRGTFVGSAHALIKQHKLCKRYHKALLDLGIIRKRRNGNAMETIWLKGAPDKVMVNQVWGKIFRNRRSENFIGIDPYFVGREKLHDHLTMTELKQLWAMYQEDCSIQTIALYLKINRAYALECIEAAKHLYGGGLERLYQRKIREKYLKPKDAPKTPIIIFDKPTTENKRPEAIYTNQSEWQRFVNTGS